MTYRSLRTFTHRSIRAMPLWLPFYHEADVHMHKLLSEISASTIDRHLDKFRETAKKGLSSTNPSLLKNKIPIELLDHQIIEPGFIEADTVAHCGTSLAGDFVIILGLSVASIALTFDIRGLHCKRAYETPHHRKFKDLF